MGELLLLPNLLGDCRHHQPFLPASVDKAVKTIDGLIAESDRGGRRYLSRFDLGDRRPQDIPLALFKGKEDDLDFYLEPMRSGERWGLISDAGLPCIADPGSRLVARARKVGIPVKAFIGPSALMLGLMLSGLPGQEFIFHGYLPRNPAEVLKKWEKQEVTHIFIDAPYRSEAALEHCLEALHNRTKLCVAWDLTLSGQGVMVHPVEQWKRLQKPKIDKHPTMFIFRKST